MNAPSEARKEQDRRVVLSLLILTNVIAGIGFIHEYNLIGWYFAKTGLAGVFIAFYAVLYGTAWWVLHRLGRHYGIS